MISSIGKKRTPLGNDTFSFAVISPKTSHASENIKSFTLLEILLVVVILGIVVGFAVPNFQNTFNRFQLSETAKDIASLMRYAQGRAIMKGKKQQLEFDSEHSRYWLTEQVKDEEQDSAIYETIKGRYGRVFGIPKEIKVDAENPHIRFYPDGKIDKARIFVHDGSEHYYTISTKEQTGYVQIYDFQLP